jgi:hypothetical protein
VNRCGHIEDAEFNSAKKWMRADIPPDPFPIVDAVCLDESLYVIIKIAPGRKHFRHTTTWERFPDRRTI